MKLPTYLFEWPSRHNVHLALPLLLLLSFILHGLSILVFQIYYPRSSAPPFRSAQLYFLQPGSPEAKALAPMLAASDPALFSPAEPFGPNALKVPGSQYMPGFDDQAPILEALPSATEAVSARSSQVRLTAIRSAADSPVEPGLPTVVQLSGDLKGRKLTPPSQFIFTAPPRQILKPVEFLVEVSPQGTPLHVLPLFPQASSGVEATDRQALTYLLQSRFDPVGDSTSPVWGYVKFLWGSDVDQRKEP
jgi:hypothetical protein